MLERLKKLFGNRRENPAAKEAERLIVEHGALALFEARSALLGTSDPARTEFASRVVEEVRRQTGRRGRADTATRMAMRELVPPPK